MRKVITSSRQRGPGRQKQYDAKAHRDWCDLNNKGICHFGAVPLSYLISFLRFDVFHGRGNIVKVAGMYIRRLFDGDINSIEKFAKILADLPGWGDYEISPWITGDSQSRLKGKHTKSFTHNIGKITDALSEMRLPHEVSSFNKSLKAFEVMSSILGCMIIDTYEAAVHYLPDIPKDSTPKDISEKIIALYQKEAKIFYKYGMESFMSDKSVGDKETFYMHVLRFYMVDIMKETYQKHKLGPGIWTMEGFEGINSVSKRVFRNHSNRKGNLATQSLAHIILLFTTKIHDVATELAKDAKKEHTFKRRRSDVSNLSEEASQ